MNKTRLKQELEDRGYELKYFKGRLIVALDSRFEKYPYTLFKIEAGEIVRQDKYFENLESAIDHLKPLLE